MKGNISCPLSSELFDGLSTLIPTGSAQMNCDKRDELPALTLH